MAEDEVYDVAIVGAGPAGLTAGIYAARYMLKSIVFGSDVGGTANLAHDIENWPGQKGPGMQIMQSGGIVSGVGTSHRPILAQPGEMYLNREQQQGLLQMISSGGGGGDNINVNISAMDSKSMFQSLASDPKLIAGLIANAKSKGTLRGR